MNVLLVGLVLASTQMPTNSSPYLNPRLLITMQPPTIYALADKASGEAKEIFRIPLVRIPDYISEGRDAGFSGSSNGSTKRLPFGRYVLTVRQQTEITEAGKRRNFFVFFATNEAGGSLQIVGTSEPAGSPSTFATSFADGVKLAKFLRGGMAIWIHPVIPVD